MDFLSSVAVPPRSRRTFVELLIGCMLNPEGWVTRAIGAICREAHWTTYYKLIERAQVPVADSVDPFAATGARGVSGRTGESDHRRYAGSTLREDGTGNRHQDDHSHKANRPTFLNSQCWVTLALVVRVRLGSALTVPIRSWLVEGPANAASSGWRGS